MGKKVFRIAYAFFFIGIAAVSTSLAADSFTNSAKLLFLEGEVRVRPASQAEWKNAQRNAALPAGAEVLVGPKAKCSIGFGPLAKNIIRLEPASVIVLESIEPVKIRLKEGKIFTLLKGLKKGSSFEVMTPTALAAARGTGWEQTLSNVSVFDGTVQLQGSAGETLEVPAGNQVEVESDGDLGTLQELPEEALAEWQEFEKDAEEIQEQVAEEVQEEGEPEEAQPDSAADESADTVSEEPKESPTESESFAETTSDPESTTEDTPEANNQNSLQNPYTESTEE